MTDLITLASKQLEVHHSQASIGCGWSPVATWAFGIVIVGAILLFFSFLPGWFNTMRTKDTASMSLSMWIVSVVGLVFLVTFYALGMANRPKEANGSLGPVSAQFTVVFVCEALSMLLSIHVLVYKLINMSKAKQLGITEKEYCEQLYAKSEGHNVYETIAKAFTFKKNK